MESKVFSALLENFSIKYPKAKKKRHINLQKQKSCPNRTAFFLEFDVWNFTVLLIF